jgi:hypothetical protein
MSMFQKIITTSGGISYSPGWYYADASWSAPVSATAALRYTLRSPNDVRVNINGVNGSNLTQYSLQLASLATAANWDTQSPTDYTVAENRAGKDFYIYLVAPTEGTVPKIVISASPIAPSGYSTTTSKLVGGFHCVCLAYGTIEGHPLTGYLAGDIIPNSVWDLKNYSSALIYNVGQVLDPSSGIWVGIYPPSGTGANTTSVNGGMISVSRSYYDFVDDGRLIGMRLARGDEFQSFAALSNEGTVISTTAIPSTGGGHSDSAGRRCISAIGVEDCCGIVHQWLNEQSYRFDAADANPAWGWKDPSGGKGKINGQGTYGLVMATAGGAGTSTAANCGSRSRDLSNWPWNTSVDITARFVAKGIIK